MPRATHFMTTDPIPTSRYCLPTMNAQLTTSDVWDVTCKVCLVKIAKWHPEWLTEQDIGQYDKEPPDGYGEPPTVPDYKPESLQRGD